jgi:hypothetical protein
MGADVRAGNKQRWLATGGEREERGAETAGDQSCQQGGRDQSPSAVTLPSVHGLVDRGSSDTGIVRR